MKFSELWMREWVNPAIDSNKLAQQLTMAGLEVDGVNAVAGTFQGVLIGEVVECSPHPNADKLRITKIAAGQERLLDIVCGASNCRQGLKVAVATVGAVLPGDISIKSTRLRGEISEGMLCSWSELGIATEQHGIIELPQDAPVGTDLRDYLKLNDNTIDISVTPNRADCLSIQGVARDVAALNKLPLMELTPEPIVEEIPDTFSIRVESKQACPRYLGRVIRGINITAPTPLWMAEKLRRCGLRSIDPVVDITNYVLMELGQPMHAFDLDRIDGEIVVRQAQQDEALILLDGSHVKLDNDILVIADRHKVLALAGIFGGEHSGVNVKTSNILLECAFFSPIAITGRARRYGLHTEASHRYERGVDPALCYLAIQRATALLLAICGGQAGPVIDVTHEAELPKVATITLRREKLDRLIGHPVPDQEVTDILSRLGCQVTGDKNIWQIVAPGWRYDLAIEEDLIEEVARLYGYNNIPDVPVQAALLMTRHSEADLSLKRVKTLLVDKGYQEAITYSFVDPKTEAMLHPDKQPLLLPMPISSEMSAMRLSLLNGLLGAVIYNQNRQQVRIRLFECGLRFIPDTQSEPGVCQDLMLAAVISGDRHDEQWSTERESVDFYDLKGDLETILELTGKLDAVEFRTGKHPALHPGQNAEIFLGKQSVGYIGVIHPGLADTLGLNKRTVVFELLWQHLAQRQLPEIKEISRFPANRRDIAIVVAESVPVADIIDECKKVSVNQLVGVNLFDVYRGKGVAEGCKSLAISLILQDTSRTLEEDEIAATVARCVVALKERFQATLRD